MHGSPYLLTGSTGTMAAALAANSIVFAMGALAKPVSSSGTPPVPLTITSLRLVYTALVASAAPITAGRALRVYKASDNAQTMPAGGTALTAIAARTFDSGASSGLTGAQIAGTAGLTVSGFTRGSVPLLTMDLMGEGAVGARLERFYSADLEGAPIMLDPGEILVVSNPAVFDLLLTWQLSVDVVFARRDVG